MVLLGALVLPALAFGQAPPVDPWGPPPPPSRPLRDAAVDVAWMGAAAGLDLASTRHALARCAGCYEGNPLMRSSGQAAAVKLAATAAAGWGCYELRKRGHRRAATIARWTIVGLWGGAAANNMIQARR